MPGEQSAQSVAPVADGEAALRPEGQLRQTEAPVDGIYVPAAQLLQTDAPVDDVYNPTSHARH